MLAKKGFIFVLGACVSSIMIRVQNLCFIYINIGFVCRRRGGEKVKKFVSIINE